MPRDNCKTRGPARQELLRAAACNGSRQHIYLVADRHSAEGIESGCMLDELGWVPTDFACSSSSRGVKTHWPSLKPKRDDFLWFPRMDCSLISGRPSSVRAHNLVLSHNLDSATLMARGEVCLGGFMGLTALEGTENPGSFGICNSELNAMARSATRRLLRANQTPLSHFCTMLDQLPQLFKYSPTEC